MPELPEVEFNRVLIDRSCLNKKIFNVTCEHDSIVFRGASPATIQSYLIGKSFVATGRHGKLFWCTLESEPSFMLMHLGMTGFVQIKGQDRAIYRAAPEKEQLQDWPPKYSKLVIEFSDTQLAFGDARRLGKIVFSNSLGDHLSKLGFDPLINPPDSLQVSSKKHTPIKSVLLDQSFVAGVGNWMADDILYQAGIHPCSPVGRLSPDDLFRLLNSIVALSKLAVDLRLHGKSYPEHWIFNFRWKRLKQSSIEYQGISFQVTKVSGRTTFYCPERQRLLK